MKAKVQKKVNTYEAKTHFSKLLQIVQKGEEVIIANAGKPIAKLISFDSPILKRNLGKDKGKIWISPDFDAPLPSEILQSFE